MPGAADDDGRVPAPGEAASVLGAEHGEPGERFRHSAAGLAGGAGGVRGGDRGEAIEQEWDCREAGQKVHRRKAEPRIARMARMEEAAFLQGP